MIHYILLFCDVVKRWDWLKWHIRQNGNAGVQMWSSRGANEASQVVVLNEVM